MRSPHVHSLFVAFSLPWLALGTQACNVIAGRDNPVLLGLGPDGGSVLPSPSDGGSDGTVSRGGGEEPDGSDGSTGTDAAPDGPKVPEPPDDFACTGTWTDASHADPRCDQRKDFIIAADAIDTNTLSIAVSARGTVAIAFDTYATPDQASLIVRSFPRTSKPILATGETIPIEGPFGTVYGVHAAIRATVASDEFHLAYLAAHDGEVMYRRYTVDGGFTPEERVGSGATNRSWVSLARNGADDAMVVYFNPTTSKLVARRRAGANGGWDSPTFPGSSFVGTTDRDLGRSAVDFDPSGTPVVAYARSRFGNDLSVEASDMQGALWGAPRTLDVQRGTGRAGHSLSFAISASTRYAAYYVETNVGTDNALHLATYQGQSDVPGDALLDYPVQTFPSMGIVDAAAVAVDGFGLVHLLYAHVSSATSSGLYYRRQTKRGGQLTWIEEMVALDAFSPDSYAQIALHVDAAGRPYIAYLDERTLAIHYATRFDR